MEIKERSNREIDTITLIAGMDLERVVAYVMAQEDEVVKHRTLAAGCKKHPAYRAKRKPTAKCPTCRSMWALAQN